MQQEHERLLDAQASLNQREDHIFGKSQELAELQKGLESAKSTFEEERRAFEDRKSNLEIELASLARREEVCIHISFVSTVAQHVNQRTYSIMFCSLAIIGCL